MPEEKTAVNVAASTTAQPREILVLNRDPELRTLLNQALFRGNFSSTQVTTGKEAMACLEDREIDLVLVSIEDRLTPEARDFLVELRESWANLPVVAIGPRPPGELVREVLLCGVRDFVLDPLDTGGLVQRLREMLPAEGEETVTRKAVSSGSRRSGRAATTARPGKGEAAKGGPTVVENGTPLIIFSKNPRMSRLLDIADTIAPTDSTVLVLGESGTGKEILARRIHHKSERAQEPFVEVNCGALPENLLESQLYGHEKGSFTGAVQRQLGLFEVANHGTIFLDEIGEMGTDMQVKLLRVLQNHEFRRIGGSQNLRVDVRVIAATNHDLKADVDAKVFRADLFYRLNVICLEIPPLRERLEEVPALVEVFCERLAREKGLRRKVFQPSAVERLQKCRWLGNVRELENAVERLVLLTTGDEITTGEVEEHLEDKDPQESPFAPTLTLDEVKSVHIAAVLKANGGNKMRTARLLGINVKTLYNLIKSLEINIG